MSLIVRKGKDMTQTLLQDMQYLLFSLLRKHILSLQGTELQKDSNTLPEEYISKQDVADKILDVLNDFGEICQDDDRLKKEVEHEIIAEQSINQVKDTERHDEISS